MHWDAQALRKALQQYPSALMPDPVLILDQTRSTNDALKEHIQQHGIKVPALCLAHSQTHGRGQRGNQWIAPPGKGVYMTLALPLPVHLLPSGLSLFVGLTLRNSFPDPIRRQITLKWPNDLYVRSQKLGGVLVESTPDWVLIGVGINAFPDDAIPGISLQDLAPLHAYDYAEWFARWYADFCAAFSVFQTQGLAPFAAAWNAVDCFQNQWVAFVRDGVRHIAINRGIDATGALQLQEPSGDIQHHVCGDIELCRPHT